MNFTSIIFKNVKHNIKNYLSFLIGNSFIMCILFMFFNLIFNKKFMNAKAMMFIKSDLETMIALMVAFSVIFIMYTTASFTKYRGKEFGVYYTIGLTSKNILKILSCENAIIAGMSFVFGTAFGCLFSKLFYTAIIKILRLNKIHMGITLESFGLMFIIAFLIFIYNSLYQAVFLKKSSILQILKSNSKKGIGSVNSVIGIIAVGVLAVSLIIFSRMTSKQMENNNKVITASIIAAAVSMYFIIGYVMGIVVKISKLFKGFYNSNILVLNSLSHRFMDYHKVLYIVTLLVSGAMLFMSMTYSSYKSVKKQMNLKYTYDLSFVLPEDKVSSDLKNIIESTGADVKSYNLLEGINVPDMRDYDGRVKWFNFQTEVISKSNYEKITKKNIDIQKDHALYLHLENHSLKGGLIIDFLKDEDEINKLSHVDGISIEDYKKMKGGSGFMYIPSENKVNKSENIGNYFFSNDYARTCKIVLNDDDYNKLKQNSMKSAVCCDVLVNLNNNGDYGKYKTKIENALNQIGGTAAKESLIIKREIFDDEISSEGFDLFMYSFLGMMLLVGSAVTLYFKTFTSLNDDKDEAGQLFRIGLTSKEIDKVLIEQLGAVFIVPPVIAILLISFYLSKMYTLIPGGDYMWKCSLTVFCVYGAIQILFFILTSCKYLNEIND